MREAVTILALDIATTTGWACGRLSDRLPIFGAQRIAPPGATPGACYLAFGRWLSDLIAVHAPGALFIEEPLDPRHIDGHSSIETTKRLFRLGGMAQAVAEGKGITRVEEVKPSTIRKFFIGHNPKRDIAKRETIKRARMLGCDVMSDDAADAIALWFYGVGQMNPVLSGDPNALPGRRP